MGIDERGVNVPRNPLAGIVDARARAKEQEQRIPPKPRRPMFCITGKPDQGGSFGNYESDKWAPVETVYLFRLHLWFPHSEYRRARVEISGEMVAEVDNDIPTPPDPNPDGPPIAPQFWKVSVQPEVPCTPWGYVKFWSDHGGSGLVNPDFSIQAWFYGYGGGHLTMGDVEGVPEG